MKATANCGPALEGPALLPTERTTAAAGSLLRGHLPSLPPPLCHRPLASFPDRRESSPQSQGEAQTGEAASAGRAGGQGQQASAEEGTQGQS